MTQGRGLFGRGLPFPLAPRLIIPLAGLLLAALLVIPGKARVDQYFIFFGAYPAEPSSGTPPRVTAQGTSTCTLASKAVLFDGVHDKGRPHSPAGGSSRT
jgi:hypothetical protein